MNPPKLEFKYSGNTNPTTLTIKLENITVKARRDLERIVQDFFNSYLDRPEEWPKSDDQDVS